MKIISMCDITETQQLAHGSASMGSLVLLPFRHGESYPTDGHP